MENSISGNKIGRILSIYTKLINGQIINKSEEAKLFSVNERSIQRDIDDIREFLEDEGVKEGVLNTVIYDRDQKGYRLEKQNKMQLSNGEILAVCKILLDSRAFTKVEMDDILDRLVQCCIPKENRKVVSDLIRNEAFHYIELRHHTDVINRLWEIGQAIRNHQYIFMHYLRAKDDKIVTRGIKPVAIMFSEFYFYLIGFHEREDIFRKYYDVANDPFPTIYRIDRIQNVEIKEKRFDIPYSSRFEEGEFRKRIQFMFSGKLEKVTFRYTGWDVDSVLDRLPTAKIISQDEKGFTIQAEVFGKGVDMWLRSQGEYVEKL